MRFSDSVGREVTEAMHTHAGLRAQLQAAAPDSLALFDGLAERLVAPALESLRRLDGRAPGFPKTFNDPIWGSIELYDWEVALLDSPLLQRLRGIRQLGMANLVYHGATHDRFSHSLGVLAAAARVLTALEGNAAKRRRFGQESQDDVPEPSALDRQSVRLAGLLHDIGHGPFSHASEHFTATQMPRDFPAMLAALQLVYPDAKGVGPGEAFAVLVILSEIMQRVFEHPRFAVPREEDRARLGPAIAARILGSRVLLDAGYLGGVISGPIDADKLDYMARDSHFSGLPMGIDVDRIVSNLEVITVTPRNAPDPALRAQALRAPKERLHTIGIAPAGVSAYEQLVVGRVLLYDRIYFHHKVRAGEAMLRRMLGQAVDAGLAVVQPEMLLGSLSDDSLVHRLAETRSGDPAGRRAVRLARSIQQRRLHYRALAVATRFIAEGGEAGGGQRFDALLEALADEGRREALERLIENTARALAGAIPELADSADLEEGDVLIDVPRGHVAVPAPIFTRGREGRLVPANLHFDPTHWAQAHRTQRFNGHVFAPREHLAAVATAAQIVFAERLHLVLSRDALMRCKTDHLVRSEWFQKAADLGLCSQVRAAALAA